MRRTIADLPASVRVVVLGDVPQARQDVVACLSSNLETALDCSLPESQAVNAEAMALDRAGARAAGATFVDLTMYFCGDVCPAIQGDTLVYRDWHHLTASFSEKFAPVFLSSVLGG